MLSGGLALELPTGRTSLQHYINRCQERIALGWDGIGEGAAPSSVRIGEQ